MSPLQQNSVKSAAHCADICNKYCCNCHSFVLLLQYYKTNLQLTTISFAGVQQLATACCLRRGEFAWAVYVNVTNGNQKGQVVGVAATKTQ
jgi:hypothetical protein